MHMYIRRYSKKEDRERVKKKRERTSVWICMRPRKRERMHASVRVIMHTMHFYALLHLYVLHRLFFCFFVCLFSFVFNYQFSFTLLSLFLSLSPHFMNSLKRTFRISSCPSSFSPSIDHHNILSSPKSSNRTNVKSGVSALSSTSTAFGTAASNARLEQTGNGHIDEALRQQALAEEEAAMNQYKVLADY